jgi:hypothetical protein
MLDLPVSNLSQVSKIFKTVSKLHKKMIFLFSKNTNKIIKLHRFDKIVDIFVICLVLIASRTRRPQERNCQLVRRPF